MVSTLPNYDKNVFSQNSIFTAIPNDHLDLLLLELILNFVYGFDLLMRVIVVITGSFGD